MLEFRTGTSTVNSVAVALNELTYKEYIPAGLVVVFGASGSGKTILVEQYAHEILEANGQVYWITTEELPATLKKSMEGFGWQTEKFELGGKFQIVDAVSATRLGWSENIGRGVLGLDPSGMLMAITDRLRKANLPEESTKFVIIIDSLSRLLLSCETKSVIDFVSSLSSRLENIGIKGIATLTDSAHDEKILNSITFSCNGTIRLRIKEVDEATRLRQMRIESLRGRRHDEGWKSYKVSNRGLEIEI